MCLSFMHYYSFHMTAMKLREVDKITQVKVSAGKKINLGGAAIRRPEFPSGYNSTWDLFIVPNRIRHVRWHLGGRVKLWLCLRLPCLL